MSNNKRQPGFYRVKLNGRWRIAEYDFREWVLPGNEETWSDSEFELIDETPINPEPVTEGERLQQIGEAAHFHSQGNALYAAQKMGFIQGANWADTNPNIIDPSCGLIPPKTETE